MTTQNIPCKIYLNENEMPTAWYNLRADMKNKPAPLLNPGTKQPMTAQELSGVFCEELVKQELDDTTPFFEIPGEIRQFYKMYRPSPLVRASCPSFTRGKYAYDFCDTGMVCPLAKMYTLGSGFIPAPQPRRRPALPRHELHPVPALRRRPDGSHLRKADRGL